MTEKYVQIKERQLYKENSKAACQRGQNNRMDDIIKDTIIVSKININTFREIEEGLIQDGNLEKEQIAAEYEAIVKKQLQMLQADERGRQALQNEIAEIRRKQEKRAEVLRTRARALETEKERAKRIANRPPPLPRSVRLLLKEQAKKDLELINADVASNLSPLEEILEEDVENSEDKENIDEEYLAEKRKMQEERDKKANKRFNEALKKDRQKQEHDAILKEIENAEKLNRRQMARNISEPMGKVPCYLPDKLHHAEKQVAMEDAVEGVFKKKSPKEHAVEDLEGYQDKWEAKYKQIDSVMESRMVDCVPSFVRENYSYLLQEETALQCGKRFSGLDDSTDDLNTAYIESPPADILSNSKEIDAVISQLDQMRVELNEAYEKEFKPLLEAGAVPKVVSLDKSVEANILKLPTEDKAVEVERTPPRKEAPLSSRSVQVDILQGGVMSYQRRDLGKMYRSHANNSGRYLPESFTCQSDSATEVRSPRSALESWSSSSYWSLPSKHGLPKVCKFCDSPGCTVPLVEDEKLHKDCVPLAKTLCKQSEDLTAKSLLATKDSADELVKASQSSSDELHSSTIKSKLTSYIQLVADKYLRKSTSPESLGTQKEVPVVSDPTSPKADSKGPTAFSKSKVIEHVEISDRIADTDSAQTSLVSSEQFSRRRSEVIEEISTHTREETGQYANDDLGLNLLKSSEYALLTNINSSSEDELLRNCREVIAANISDVFSADNRFESLSAEFSPSPDQSASSEVATEQHYRKESLTGYVYHDLSTIPEMDSALTDELSLNATRGSLGKKSLLKRADLEDISSDEVDTTSVSLVDAPVSVVSEIAKGIRFIRKPTPEPIEVDDAGEEHVPLISGTLSNLQTPPSVVSKVQSTKYKTSSIQSLSDDQVSNFSSVIDGKTPDSGSGSYGLHTPSPMSTLKSVSVAKSQAYPYSSSYRDSNTTRSHLTSTSALSKYFQDVSSIRHDSEASSKGSAEAATPVQMDAKRQTELHESSSGTFLPMTPQSYLSTPGENTEKHNSMKRPHLSSLQNKNVLGVFKTPESNTGSFKPLTPHSYFSSISKITTKHSSLNAKPFSPRKDSHYTTCTGVPSWKSIDDSNPKSFKPLSLISNVSTPKDITSNQKDVWRLDKVNAEYQHESTTSNNFQAMTPHSDFSSPSDIHASSYNRFNDFSTGKEMKKGSVNVRVIVPNPFKNKAASPTHEERGTSDGPKSFTYPIQFRLDLKDFANSSEDIENYVMDDSHVQRDLAIDSLKKGPSVMSSKTPPENNAASVNTAVKRSIEDEKAVKVSSSGFVPQLTAEDFTPYERKKMDENKKDLFAAEMSASAKSATGSKADFSSKSSDRPSHSTNNDAAIKASNNANCKSSLKDSASTINNDLKYLLEKVPNSTSLVENERGYSSTHGAVSSTSPNPILQALAQQLASSEKLRTPSATPSNGSSTENLSEMFVESKITFQSTPIKSIEEIIQETGILDEPSLTLMNTEITIKPDSPEKFKSLSDGCSLFSDDLRTPSSLQSAFFTPNTLDTPSDSACSPYCDSPSMMSFLKHEQSCLTSGIVEENRSSSKKTPRNDYKKRTKRLWNNLEEVQTKKLLEEKREQMKKNRIKMKSYSKKVTTPKKN